ncbi:MAG: hypothetical protein HQL09_10560 [Nitrospirae bacterium]|nr:hypothetical protein [Nitrospirota bacterium]
MKQSGNKSKCRINEVKVTTDTLTDRCGMALFGVLLKLRSFKKRLFLLVVLRELRVPETIGLSVTAA